MDTDKDKITQIFTETLSAEEVKLIRKVLPNDIILLMSEEEVNEEYSIWIEELIWDEIEIVAPDSGFLRDTVSTTVRARPRQL